MVLVTYCLCSYYFISEFICGLLGCHVCTVGSSYHLVLYLEHDVLRLMYHVVSVTVLTQIGTETKEVFREDISTCYFTVSKLNFLRPVLYFPTEDLV